jgi:orotate phosphoribosyltransferase
MAAAAPPQPNPREQLLRLLATLSFRLGQFTLASGATSDYYIDCRATTLHAEGARLTGRVVYDLIQKERWKPKAIGGLTMGADPIVTAVSILSAQSLLTRAPARTKPLESPDDYMIHGFLVRKAEKTHGTGQRIEGFRKEGAKVVIVDDVCTTGGSTIQAIEAAKQAGFNIVGVVCLVEREEAKGRPAVEQAAAPAKFISVFTANDVRKMHESLSATKPLA